MNKLKVGIIGANGFIGSNLVYALRDSDVDQVLINGPQQNGSTSRDGLIADISDFNKLKSYLKGVDRIIHLAGLASVRESFANPVESLKVNTLGTTNILNVCKALNINEVIIISSAEVYGNPSLNPVKEYAELKPLSPYGVSKVALEQMCFVYHKAYDMKFKIIRPFSIYGPGMSRKSIIYEIYKRMLCQQDITLFNISSKRDYCYIDDLVSAIKSALLSNFNGFDIYNAGTSIGTTAMELAQLIQLVMKVSGKISQSEFIDRPQKADVNNLVACNIKALTDLSWQPTTKLKNGLAITLKSFSNES